MVGVRLRQYHGPNHRHAQACIELSFLADEIKFSLSPIGDLLRKAGLVLSAPLPASPLALEEAIGVLAAAVLTKFVAPEWSAGREGDRAWVCLSHAYPTIARAALIACHAAIVEREAVPEQLRILIARVAGIDPITDVVMSAAAAMGLEAMFVSHRARIYQIGQGASGRHHVELASQDDGYTGVRLSINKLATVEVLRRLGLPTTRAIGLNRGQDLASVVQQVGFPCVVKPLDNGKGKGITTHILDERQLAAAVPHALEYGRYPLLVENHVAGDDHRLTVIGGRLLWAYRLRPAHVIGDGAATLEELIGRENERRVRASPAHKAYLLPITSDAELLQYVGDRYAFDLQSIPAPGHRIELCGQANLARGGTLKDVTAHVHPDNRELASQVARLFRLDVLGIDFITSDIGRSWKETPSAIVEVNSTPGISGLGDAAMVLREAFPGPQSGRVPCFVIAGSAAYRQAIEAKVAGVLKRRGVTAARADYPDGSLPPPPSALVAFSPYSLMVETALLDPSAAAILVSCEDGALEQLGFPLRKCDVLFSDRPVVSQQFKDLAARVVLDVPAGDEVSRIVADAIDEFDAARSSAWPALEWLHANGEASKNGLKLRCWRVTPQSRSGFWQRVPGGAALGSDGMIGYADVAIAVVRFADARLREVGEAASAVAIDFPKGDGAWRIPHVEADIALPQDRAKVVGEALAYGVKTVNLLLGSHQGVP